MRCLLAGICLTYLPERLTTPQTSIISLKTLYRWKAQIKGVVIDWMNEQRKKLTGIYEEDESLLPLYRHGVSRIEELQFFLWHFFEGLLPAKGKMLSTLNAHLLTRRW